MHYDHGILFISILFASCLALSDLCCNLFVVAISIYTMNGRFHSLLGLCSNFSFMFSNAVIVNALLLVSTVLSLAHVKIALTSLFMKTLSCKLVNRLNLATHLHLLLK